MNKKYNLEFVKNFVTNKGGVLLSEIYVNPNIALKVMCNKGHIFNPTFGSMFHKNTWCNTCSYELKKQTWLKNYGVDNPAKNKTIKDKIRDTCLARYGVEYLMQYSTFKQKSRKTSLIKYGKQFPLQSEEIKNKAKKTLLERYGVEFSHQNREILTKALKSQNISTSLFHWKTNKEIVCTGSYEKSVVEYFNKHKIDFQSQLMFRLPNGKRYFVDFYLPEKDLYIEVKGYFRKDALEKWNWFHENYPNSELWNKDKLKELGVL